jgi:hypothetical protein
MNYTKYVQSSFSDSDPIFVLATFRRVMANFENLAFFCIFYIFGLLHPIIMNDIWTVEELQLVIRGSDLGRTDIEGRTNLSRLKKIGEKLDG